MDNNNFNNEPNNEVTTENQQTTETGSYSQPEQNAQQNAYGSGTYDANQQNAYGSGVYDTNQQNAYGNGVYGANQQNTYGNGYVPYNAYGTVNGGPVDDNGKPLKNNFAMKLTFSILEIICCNLLSLIMGILGCVFTTKANNAYKEGRWEDFKSAKKTSAIVLWVGLVGVIISIVASIIMVVGVLKSANDFVENEDSYWSDDLEDDWADADDYEDYDYDDYSDDDYAWDDEQDVEKEETVVTVAGDIDFEDTVIYDANGVTVTATSISWYEDYAGNQYPEINVIVANGSDKDITVSCEYLSINGIVMPYASIYCDVTAGMNAKDKIDCDYDSVWTYCDFDEIEYFTVCLNVHDENYNDFSDMYDFYSVLVAGDTSAYGPDESFSAILSQNGFDIYYLGTNEDEYGAEEFVFFVRNNTEMYVHVNTDNLAVDSFMQDGGYDYSYLHSGDGAILFADVDDDVDISSVSGASIKFEAYDTESYYDILDTGSITFIQ